MPTFVAPVAPVTAPPRTARPYGLGSVLGWRTGDRWESGVTWSSLPCQPVLGRGGMGCVAGAGDTIPGLPKPIEDAGGPAIGEATPFVLFGLYRCLTVGNSVQDAQAWAEQALLAGEEARAEQALWTGDLGNVPNLSGANGYPAPVAVGSFTDPVEALAKVEQAIATGIGSQGVIHMAPAMATRLAKYLDPRGGRQYTRAMGTPVVVGAGYPDGAVVGTAALFGYRGEVFDSSARPGDLMDRQYNWMNAIAERTMLVGFDPCPVYKATVTGGSSDSAVGIAGVNDLGDGQFTFTLTDGTTTDPVQAPPGESVTVTLVPESEWPPTADTDPLHWYVKVPA